MRVGRIRPATVLVGTDPIALRDRSRTNAQLMREALLAFASVRPGDA